MARKGSSQLEVPVADQRRAQIVRAVLASITEEGVERTTMRNVAERAGVSTGTIAYYFTSKQEMIDAALLEASREYVECFRREHTSDEDLSLDELVDRFLSPENADAVLVLQMIEIGLHNARLREVHKEMLEIGRTAIEDAIRRGVESGRYRSDVDPMLAAAMFHAVLVWWGAELLSNATSQEFARQAARLALRLLEAPRPAEPSAGTAGDRSEATIDRIRAALRSDRQLPPKAAEAIADAVERLYAAVRISD
jgi:AcrR family transcriptional regulator